jgi:hypothetical protein
MHIAATLCEAGGFLRRVPEVGEWARYEMTVRYTHNIGQETESVDEHKGSLLLKCVGEETIDDQRYLWLEHRIEEIRPTSEFWVVTKVLVPEEGLVQDTLSFENVRGWEWRRGDEVKPLDLPTAESKESESADLPGFLGSFPPATSGRMEERTVIVDGVEVQLSIADVATLPPLEVANSVHTGEVVWWVDDDLAFGTASVQYMYFQTDLGKASADACYDRRFDLVATGTDAVSELPDHN